jgi:hypothetical protein
MKGDIKVWRLSQDEIEAYRPGMDLGKPHSIEKPVRVSESISQPNGDMEAARRKGGAARSRSNTGKAITEQEYKRLHANGLTDIQIAERYRIKLRTLKDRKSAWKREKAKKHS